MHTLSTLRIEYNSYNVALVTLYTYTMSRMYTLCTMYAKYGEYAVNNGHVLNLDKEIGSRYFVIGLDPT